MTAFSIGKRKLNGGNVSGSSRRQVGPYEGQLIVVSTQIFLTGADSFSALRQLCLSVFCVQIPTPSWQKHFRIILRR